MWTQSHAAVFFFGGILLGYCGHMCIFTIWQTYWDAAVSSIFVKKAAHYSLPGNVPFRQDHSLWQQKCTTSPVTDDTLNHWAFYFQGSRFPYHVLPLGQILCVRLLLPCKDSRLLHFLCKMTFQLCVKALIVL